MDVLEDAKLSIESIFNKVTSEVKSAFEQNEANDGRTIFQMFSDQIMSFVSAVDWKEPWIIGLISTECLLFVLVILTRKYTTFQAILFMILGSIIFCAKYINEYCAKNWDTFANQQYFDKYGLFISVMLSGPLLLVNMLIVVNHLVVLSNLIVKVKRAELRVRAKNQKKEN